MARPTVIDDETILEAARAVFLERGIGATTAEVAARAGVSEGTLFRRHKTKDELFRTAMQQGMCVEALDSDLPQLVGQGEMKDQLYELTLRGIDTMRVVVPIVMMSWSNPGPSGYPPHLDEPNPRPIRVMRSLASYFEAEMRLGRVRRRDPEMVARVFMGAIWHFAMLEMSFRAQDILPMPRETFARGFVELQWPALDPSKDR